MMVRQVRVSELRTLATTCWLRLYSSGLGAADRWPWAQPPLPPPSPIISSKRATEGDGTRTYEVRFEDGDAIRVPSVTSVAAFAQQKADVLLAWGLRESEGKARALLDEERAIEDPYPFSRLTEEGEGTGLGLYLVAETVRAHGAQLEMEQKAKGGFSVRAVWPQRR